MLSDNFKLHLKNELSRQSHLETEILSYCPVFGGSINKCFAISDGKTKWFLKVNSSNRFPHMLELEMAGMNLLRDHSLFEIPQILLCGEDEGTAYLIMEFIEEGRQSIDFWENFGMRLAMLHQCTSPKFGLDQNNYIGSLGQSNKHHSSWIDFFIQERLLPQINLAQNSLGHNIINGFDQLFLKLGEIFPNEPPALLHGDLWSGNFMINAQGNATIFDPAVYFGHREMDLAMTKLFGGFDHSFYDSYHAHYPLHKGWEERMDLCNLYPLLVHVNLFGGTYVNRVKTILKRYL